MVVLKQELGRSYIVRRKEKGMIAYLACSFALALVVSAFIRAGKGGGKT